MEVILLTIEDLKLKLHQHSNKYTGHYLKIDNAIQPLVDYCNNLGFVTFASCSSHIFNYKNQPVFDGQAYVAFWYLDEDLDKVKEFLFHKFPKSKAYKIQVQYEYNYYHRCNVANFDIMFQTRYNRLKYLRNIYRSLGITDTKYLILEKAREDYETTVNQNFTVRKNGQGTISQFNILKEKLLKGEISHEEYLSSWSY